MPFAGTLTKKAHFKRSVSGNMGRFSGTSAGALGIVSKAAAGVLTFASTLTRKVRFKRSVSGSLHMAGESSKTAACRRRTVSGSIHFAGTAVIAALGLVKRGLNRLGLKIEVD